MRLIKSLIPDLLILSGAFAVSFGAYEIYQPAGYICAGIFSVVIGVVMAMNIARKPD